MKNSQKNLKIFTEQGVDSVHPVVERLLVRCHKIQRLGVVRVEKQRKCELRCSFLPPATQTDSLVID